MKTVTILSVLALVGVTVVADDVKVQTGRGGVEVDVNRDTRVDETRSVEQTPHVMRTSDLIGLNVRNRANEDLGQIEDIVVDLKTGQIRYAAVSMGGFLGIGQKYFAVPFRAISFRTHREDNVLFDRTERVAVIDVTRETLDNAQGFDQDNWPNMADRRWQELNDRSYRIGTRPGADGSRIER